MKIGKLFFGMGKKHRYFIIPVIAFLALMVFPFVGNTGTGEFMAAFGTGVLAMRSPDGGGNGSKTAEELAVEAIEAKYKQSFADIRKEFKQTVIEVMKGDESKELLENRFKSLEDAMAKFDPEDQVTIKAELDKINEQAKNIATDLKAMKEKGIKNSDNKPSIFKLGSLLRETLDDSDMIEEYNDAKDGVSGFRYKHNGEVAHKKKFAVKAAIDMTTALALTPGESPGVNIGFLTNYKMSDVMLNLTRDMHVTEFMVTDPITGKYMGVLIEYAETDGTGTKAEGTASSKGSYKFKTEEFKVFTIATHYRVSEENLQDIDRLEAKLNRVAVDRIKQKLDTKVLAKTGDGLTDIKGIRASGNYTAFDPSTWTGKVESANTIDLIRKMKLQAELADEEVNVVILNPNEIDAIEGLKDAEKNYLKARGVRFDETTGKLVLIHGLVVAKNKKMDINECVVMWNQAAEIGIRKDVDFVIGWDGNDLTEGMRTIVFNIRAAMGVGKPGGVIYCDNITDDVAILTTA